MATIQNPKENQIRNCWIFKAREKEMRMQSEFETNSSTTASLSNWAISHHHNLTISQSPITHRSHNLESMTYMQITPHHCHRIIIIVQKILLLVLLQEVLLPKWSDPPQRVIGKHWNKTEVRGGSGKLSFSVSELFGNWRLAALGLLSCPSSSIVYTIAIIWQL